MEEVRELVTVGINALFLVGCITGLTLFVGVLTNLGADLLDVSSAEEERSLMVIDEIVEEVPFGWEIIEGLIRHLPVGPVMFLLLVVPPVLGIIFIIIKKMVGYIKSKL